MKVLCCVCAYSMELGLELDDDSLFETKKEKKEDTSSKSHNLKNHCLLVNIQCVCHVLNYFTLTYKVMSLVLTLFMEVLDEILTMIREDAIEPHNHD